MQGDECSKKICTCEDGTAAQGAECPTHDAAKCVKCNDVMYLTEDNKCKANECSCKNGDAAVGAACTENGANVCTACDEGYFGAAVSKSCSKIECSCENGTPGSGCAYHKEVKCTACDEGYFKVDNACKTNGGAFQFIKLDFAGENWLTFSEFAIANGNHKLPLKVVDQKEEYAKEGQWSAEATVDGKTGTCFCSKKAAETHGWIIYDVSKMEQMFTDVIFDNKNDCGYGPVRKIKVSKASAQLAGDSAEWSEVLPWTDIDETVNTQQVTLSRSPAETIEETIFSSGSTAQASNKGTIVVAPDVLYDVTMEVLRNDLADAGEKVSDVTLDGRSIGGCNPDGNDYDCNFFKCPTASFQHMSKTGLMNVDMTFVGHSKDCDCDTSSWKCSKEDTVEGRTPMTAVARFTLKPVTPPAPTDVIEQVVYSSGSEAKESNTGTVIVSPGVLYKVQMEVLRNDLSSADEKVADVKLDGSSIGGCNPDGADYDCNFFKCPQSAPTYHLAKSSMMNVDMTFVGHSKDCDCDTSTWQCSKEDTVEGRTPVTAVGRFTLTPTEIDGKYRYIKLEFEGNNWLSFAGFNVGSTPLSVVSQSTEYAAEGQWSADATADQDTATCYCTKAASETSAWIIYDTEQIQPKLMQLMFDNANRCGYGPVEKIKVSTSLTQLDADSSHWNTVLPWTAIGKEVVTKSFAPKPEETITKVVYTSGSVARPSNTGTIDVAPGVTYEVTTEVLRNGLSGANQEVTDITLDGASIGGCNPDGKADDCDFFKCPSTATKKHASSTGVINVDMNFLGHSTKCYCDKNDWQCNNNKASGVPMSAVVRFTLKPHVPGPTDVIEQVIFSSGTEAKASNTGQIGVFPGVLYKVQMEVLRNDLSSADEKVVDVKLDGSSIGGCNPDGADYDCNFFKCPQSAETYQLATSANINVDMEFVGHSKDCDCDTSTWQCSKEDTVEGRTPVTAVGRFTLTPVEKAGMYRYIKLEFEGKNWLTFASFKAGSIPLSVITQSSEYSATSQWSADVTTDDNTGTCYCTKTKAESSAWIIYDTKQIRQMLESITFDNANRCGYGPVEKIKVSVAMMQLDGDDDGWMEVLPWTNIATEVVTKALTHSESFFTELAPAGYCTDWRYPSTGTTSGGYDDLSSTPQECMERCKAKLPGTTSFYQKGTQCGCSATKSGACAITSNAAYTSYEMISTESGPTAAFGEPQSGHGYYCVTTNGGSTEPAYTQIAMGKTKESCAEEAKKQGFNFINFWSSDGRCRGLKTCPFKKDVTSGYDAKCISYDVSGA
jgi:hypothetical protein